MMKKKVLSLFLTVAMLIGVMPLCAHAEEQTSDQTTVPAEKKQDSRDGYLHARGDNPSGNENLSIVPRGKIVDLYFAVDNPN